MRSIGIKNDFTRSFSEIINGNKIKVHIISVCINRFILEYNDNF